MAKIEALPLLDAKTEPDEEKSKAHLRRARGLIDEFLAQHSPEPSDPADELELELGELFRPAR